MRRPLKLITALGNKQDLVLEIIDFFNGGNLYNYKDEAAQIRNNFDGRKLTEIHLVCTQDVDVISVLRDLKKTIGIEYPDMEDCVHEITLDCEDIGCYRDDDNMRKLVYQAVHHLADADLIIASGGRKQVTQRLIEAGLLYGCMGYLTITAPRNKEKREESAHFNINLTTARQFAEERRNRVVIKDELGDNFRSLYLLPTIQVSRLRGEKIGNDLSSAKGELTWLRLLPKADLHCHLGGSYDALLLKKMAASLLDDVGVSEERQKEILSQLVKKVGNSLSLLDASALRNLQTNRKGDSIRHALQNLDSLFSEINEKKYISNAILVDALSVDQIEEISRDGRNKNDWPKDLNWYMACGDLGGSSLLQTRRTLRLALRWLMNEAKKENVFFMEVRFSPDNYTKAGLSIRQVIETLLDEANTFHEHHPEIRVNFLIMATRHKDRASMAAHVAAAVSFGEPGGGEGARITGFDLAGQEEDNDPSKFKDIFMPLHLHFMNITIHAGEMAQDDKIWQALYDLHAKRVGHGLKLINNSKMMNYVRDYGIAIEMCPSSNTQTNSFRHFDSEEQGNEYPLKKYIQKGMTVTVNTDNRGISETTLSNEYLEAARLTQGGLSKWEIIRLIKNGFKSAFLPKNEKDRLLKEIDEKIFSIILDDYYPKQ